MTTKGKRKRKRKREDNGKGNKKGNSKGNGNSTSSFRRSEATGNPPRCPNSSSRRPTTPAF
jgi:hypothetical protein